MNNQIKLAVMAVVGIFFIGLILVLSPFTQIDSSERGLVVKFGEVQDQVLTDGLHIINPITTNVEKVTIQPIELATFVGVDARGAITKDNQTVGADIVAYFVYNEAELVEMRKKYGQEKMRDIVDKSIYQSFKNVIGTYTIFEIAEKREEIKNKVFEVAKLELEQYPVSINQVLINNFDWSAEFDRQIEITQQKAQQVKQAEQELLITERQAQKQVKEAEARKQALITEAEGKKEAAALEAEAKALEGEGIKKYNESLRATADIEITLREIENEKLKWQKWNGVFVPEQNFTPLPYNNRAGLVE